ncbi:MAG TPA: type II secretion system protein [Kofleriaceae bacterium]|nr:type II secretion system protein [Kofleriaceae bacterium]
MTTRRRRRQAGFTLIELMVALVISTILVGMILSIFSRMSQAYRGQQQISSVQQVLAAARSSIELDAKQVGLSMPQGYWIATDGATPQRHSALEVINRAGGFDPDEVRFVYADLNTQALVLAAPAPSWTAVTVDANPGFVVNDLVVVSTSEPSQGNPIGGANIAVFDACILQISAVAGTALSFSQVAPWGTAGNVHCKFTNLNPLATNSMVYKLVTHAYRIDPDQTQPRAGDGMLQMSATGDLVGLPDWQDLAYGFTDIQVAIQFFEFNDVANSDSQYDADPTRDFWSSDVMAQRLQPMAAANMWFPALNQPIPIQLSITLVARTDKNVEGIATGQTPKLTEALHPINNRLGDHDTVSLPSATDPHLLGSRIYRYTTFQVDLRNLGVGL